MRVRRHRSFRPTLDVLPGRIAPSGVFNSSAAVAQTPTPAPSCATSYYDGLISLFSNPGPYTIATRCLPVSPA
jgi:hypothetical protein